MILLGDSHTRSYVTSKYITSTIFIGSGTENNLSSKCSLFKYIFKLWLISCGSNNFRDTTVGIVIGEPDLRVAMYRGYYVKDYIQSIDNQIKHIHYISKNLRLLLKITQRLGLRISYLIGAGTPNDKLFEVARIANSHFSTVADKFSIPFFDPQNAFNDSDDKKNYFGQSVFNPLEDDFTHFSRRVALDFDKFLESTDIKVAADYEVQKMKSKFVQLKFHEKFGCYMCVYSFTLDKFLRVLTRLELVFRR